MAGGDAPLWQARRIVDARSGILDSAWVKVDERIAPKLGCVNTSQLGRVIGTAVKLADPDRQKRLADQKKHDRHLWVGMDRVDPMAAWISGRLDRVIGLATETVLRQLAEALALQGDSGSLGPLSRRAHRIKTHASWKLNQLEPGTFLWRTPAG